MCTYTERFSIMAQGKKILYMLLCISSGALAAKISIDTDPPYCYGRALNITCQCSQNSTGQPQLWNGNRPILDNLWTLNSTTTVYRVRPLLESYALSCSCPDDSKSRPFLFSPSICPDVHFPIVSSSAVTCRVNVNSGPQQTFNIKISTVSTDMGIQNVTDLISGGEPEEYVLKELQPNSTYTLCVEIYHTSNPQWQYNSTFSVTTKERILVLEKVWDKETVGLKCQLVISPIWHPGKIIWFLNGTHHINASCGEMSQKTCTVTMNRENIIGAVACALRNIPQDTLERSNEVYVPYQDIPILWPIAFATLVLFPPSVIVTVVAIVCYCKKRHGRC